MNFLMVEDFDEKREAFLNALNSKDDKVSSHGNLFSCIEDLAQNRNTYDALILDMNFPIQPGHPPHKRCGIDMLNEMYKRHISIPTVMYSMDDINLTPKLYMLGVIDFIKYDGQDLTQSVKQMKQIINAEHTLINKKNKSKYEYEI